MNTTTEPQTTDGVPGRHRSFPAVVTEGETALRTSHHTSYPAAATNSAARAHARARIATETAPTQGEQPTASEQPDRALGRRLRAYWTPPQVWAEPPASLAELARYARFGEWTKQDGPVRFLGIAYSWLAVAASTGLYYAAWILQRPGRLVTFLTVYGLLAHTPIGAWLPWPGWL